MSRLIVQAVSGESKFLDIAFHLELFVSVSFATTGAPISGLLPAHVRLCAPTGNLFDTHISSCTEASWDLATGEGSGCYALSITITKEGGNKKFEWLEGEYYPFGIQVQFTDSNNQMHSGQCVVRVQSLGK